MWQGLVEQAQGGDLGAFDELMARYQDSVVAVGIAMLGDFEQARDAAQETFIQAWRDLKRLRDRQAFPAWLFGIARNRCRDLVRRPRLPQVPLETAVEQPSAGEADPAREVARRETRQRVLQAIAELSEANRVTTTLFYINGYSVSEVAEFLEVPTGTVKRRLHEARKRLQGSVADMVEETLHAEKPGPELRAQIAAELSRRLEQWESLIAQWYRRREACPEESVEWARQKHEARLEDVRANAAQYGMQPDLELPRMLPEYWEHSTYRDDMKDLPRRWGIPEGLELVNLRDLVRDLRVSPLTIQRWEQGGLPVLHYRPWTAYDRARVQEWLAQHAAEVLSAEREAVERPLLALLRDLQEGQATAEEAAQLCEALTTAALMGPDDPVFAPRWAAARDAELQANAALYGLSAPADTWLGIPAEARVYEIRDVTRRLGLSPLELAGWARAGLPCVRLGGMVRFDVEFVRNWLAEQGLMPQRCEVRDLDLTDLFICRAFAGEQGTIEDAYEALSGRLGVM